jgi:hypothetical protein
MAKDWRKFGLAALAVVTLALPSSAAPVKHRWLSHHAHYARSHFVDFQHFVAQDESTPVNSYADAYSEAPPGSVCQPKCDGDKNPCDPRYFKMFDARCGESLQGGRG